MPRPKPTREDRREQKKRKDEWREFRKEHLYTQKKLAEAIGVSRRTVQEIEAGRVIPYPHTLRLFEALKAKYSQEG